MAIFRIDRVDQARKFQKACLLKNRHHRTVNRPAKAVYPKSLAKHYETTWCPEYAREYLLAHGMDYQFDELLTIAKGQLKLEDEYLDELSRRSENSPSTQSYAFHRHGYVCDEGLV